MTQSPQNNGGLPYNEVVEVTPAMAAAWLDRNESNRPITWNFVMQLARDMKAGEFLCTHQGIAFDTSGRLIDGQHRLWAILESDVTVCMRVFYNEPPDNIRLIDGNCPRRMSDRMTLARTLGTVRTDELATLRAMVSGISLVTKRRTLHEEMALLEKHRAAVHFSHEHLSVARPAGIANSMTRAVIARAWYVVQEHIYLSRFCEVLRTGVMAIEDERSIVTLRDLLIDGRKRFNTKVGRQRHYALTSRALLAYLQCERLTVLRAPSYEVFLLPEETE